MTSEEGEKGYNLKFLKKNDQNDAKFIILKNSR